MGAPNQRMEGVALRFKTLLIGPINATTLACPYLSPSTARGPLLGVKIMAKWWSHPTLALTTLPKIDIAWM